MKARKFQGHILPQYVYVKKKIYLYFAKDGALVKLPSDPSSAEFFAAYTECLKGEVTGTSNRTFGKLTQEYLQSDRFKKVSKDTAKAYRSKIKWLLERCEKVQVKKLKRSDIISMRDARKDQPASANKTLIVMTVILEHALDLGWISVNPAKGVPKLDTNSEMRLPWTDAEIEGFHELADPRSSLVLELCINTGQRLDDVLSMKWSAVKTDPLAGYGIPVRQQKTGKLVFIPFSDRLQAIMQRLNNQIDQKGSDYIVVNSHHPEKKLDKSAVQVPMKAIRDKLNISKTLHDLRHTCAHRLAEEGLSNEVIMAITGHGTAAMVQHYCAAAAQRRRAADAIKAMNQKEAA